MNEEQIYNPVAGFNRMIEDIEDFLNPLIFKLHPVFRIMSIMNIFVVILVFAAMLFYMVYVRKHRVAKKLKRSTNYFAAGILLLIYAILTETPLKIGPAISLNFGLVIMPLAAKLFGPVLTGAFGILQYATSFVMHSGEAFSLSSMLVAGISGMIYGWFIYSRRTKYMRCFWAKLTVNMVCNILLVPMVQGETMTTELADAITMNIVSNIFLVPVQALIIFASLLLMKKIRKMLSEVSWGL